MSMASVTLRWVNHFTRNKSWRYRHILGKIRQLFECSTTWPLYHGVLHRKIVPRILFSRYFQQSPSGRCTGFCRNRGQFLLFLFLMAHLSTSLLLPLMSIRLVFTLPASFVMKTTLRSTSNFWGWLKTSRMSPTASEAYARYWKILRYKDGNNFIVRPIFTLTNEELQCKEPGDQCRGIRYIWRAQFYCPSWLD